MGLVTVTAFLSVQHWLAFDVNVKGKNVYVNYNPNERHTSYHASGQHHVKKGRDYVKWTGGASGTWEPMVQCNPKPSDVHDRQWVSTIGWEIKDIPSVLPVVDMAGDFSIDATHLPGSSILAFEVSIVGPRARDRAEIVGFPVLQRHRIPGSAAVEIEAFLLSEESNL
jgi:hypothetical protein